MNIIIIGGSSEGSDKNINGDNRQNISEGNGNISIDFKGGSITFNENKVSIGKWGEFNVLEKEGGNYKILYKNQEMTIGEEEITVNGKE